MDNASNNDTMKAELDAALRALISDGIVQLRCFDHILNLSAKCCIAESKDMLSTIRKMIVGIRKSGKKRKLLAETCQKLNLKHKNLILDVETRWNMLKRLLELKSVIILVQSLTIVGY
jgi:hypothetical protein